MPNVYIYINIDITIPSFVYVSIYIRTVVCIYGHVYHTYWLEYGKLNEELFR